MDYLDPNFIITTLGILGIFAIVFAETGFFFCFFFPGDSLLFTAGILAASGYADISVLIPSITIAAVLGSNTGYFLGCKVGYRIFYKEDSFFFDKKHVDRTKAFFEKYGALAVALAKFVPIVRTFTPLLAGVGKMEYRKFFFYDALGAIIWPVVVVSAGYFFGKQIPGIDRFVLPLLIVVVVGSLLLPFIARLVKKPGK